MTELFRANLGTVRKQRFTLLAEPQSSASGSFTVQMLDDSPRTPKRKKANLRRSDRRSESAAGARRALGLHRHRPGEAG